jgi:hypothetical protein
MKKLSFLLTFIFTSLIALQWYLHHTNYEHNDHKLLNQTSIEKHLEDFELTGSDQVLTGVYVDSLQFLGSNDVYLSGYVWQEFSATSLEKHRPGVIFPNSVGNTTMEESYKSTLDGVTVIGWYFEVNLRQPFRYEDYPIDHKTVKVKLIPKDFNSNVILVPSLKSYDSTTQSSIFGISKDIVLAGWDINDTFFDYMPLSFDTDFGLHDNHPRTNLPELSFNIVIERDFISAFMINITLLLVSIALLYGLIMMMTSDDNLKSKYGSSVSSVIGSCAGIFFVVLVAHISVREKFPGSGIVYIEYFYLLSYMFILATIVAIYSFSTHQNSETKVFFANEAVLLKMSFWPLYSCCICLITWYHFY